MTDSCGGEKSWLELEFNDLNIHLYLTLIYGTTSEHLDFDFMVLYNVFVLSWGLTITQNSIHTISDLDRSRLTDTRSAENASIGADTDPEYRINASLVLMVTEDTVITILSLISGIWYWPTSDWKRIHFKVIVLLIKLSFMGRRGGGFPALSNSKWPQCPYWLCGWWSRARWRAEASQREHSPPFLC